MSMPFCLWVIFPLQIELNLIKDDMSHFKSQAGQDLFALEQSNYKTNGFFLEIGAYHSEKWSNTYVLEVEYAWSGLALELDPTRASQYNENRRSKCLMADATKFNYQELLDSNYAPKIIDKNCF